MRRLLSRALIAVALIAGIGTATAGVAAADPGPQGSTSAPTKVTAPANAGTSYRTQDWWL